MNPTQNKTLHTLLAATGLMKEKKNLVLSFSKGRSESSTDLLDNEAHEMISWLRTKQSFGPANKATVANKMRRKILSMAHEMHWSHATGRQVDMPRINNWCIHYGYLHKKLNDYTSEELPTLVTQFEKVYKDYLNGI